MTNKRELFIKSVDIRDGVISRYFWMDYNRATGTDEFRGMRNMIVSNTYWACSQVERIRIDIISAQLRADD